jgi:hypothetical protein
LVIVTVEVVKSTAAGDAAAFPVLGTRCTVCQRWVAEPIATAAGGAFVLIIDAVDTLVTTNAGDAAELTIGAILDAADPGVRIGLSEDTVPALTLIGSLAGLAVRNQIRNVALGSRETRAAAVAPEAPHFIRAKAAIGTRIR